MEYSNLENIDHACDYQLERFFSIRLIAFRTLRKFRPINMLRIGRFEVFTHVFGSFRLDGGAMFGSVPKNLWAKRIQPDSENCIPMVTRCLVIKDGARLILVDCGNGDKWSDKLKQIFAFKSFEEPKSFQKGEVTDLILTHLHFDHAGGVSYFDSGNSLKLTYPQAAHYLQRANWENALNPSLKERASYLSENVAILKESRLHLLDGDGEIFPGIRVHRVDGHTRGQQWVEVTDSGQALFFPTDMIPTSHHLPLAYHMGYDIHAERVMHEKLELLTQALAQNAVFVFEHDHEVAAARVKLDDRGNYVVAEQVDV